MNFGMSNAPSTFAIMMNDAFGPLIWKFVVVNIDNIIVYSQSYQEHLVNLRATLDVLRKQKTCSQAIQVWIPQGRIIIPWTNRLTTWH